MTLFTRLHNLLALLLMMGTSPLAAFEFSVTVTDTQGQSLANAVLEVRQRTVGDPPEQTAIIDQVNREFVPMVIAIAEGQSVNFPNSDNVRHHVYSFSPIKNFSTKLYADEPASLVEFPESGIATLGCNIHDSMVGYIYVSSWRDVGVSRETEAVHFNGLAENPGRLHVWHPWLDDSDNRRVVDISHLSDGDTLNLQLPITRPEQDGGFSALTPES